MTDVLTWLLFAGLYLLSLVGLVCLIVGAMAFVVNWLFGERDDDR